MREKKKMLQRCCCRGRRIAFQCETCSILGQFW